MKRMPVVIALFPLLLGGLCCAAEPVGKAKFSLDDPPQGTFVDDWLEIYLGEHKAGYANSTLTREGDVIASRMLMTFRISRADTPVEISVMEATRESLDARPLSFETTTNMSVMQTTLRGRVRGGKVTVTKTVGNASASIPAPAETFDFPSGALMSWGLYRKEHEMKLEKGTTVEVAVYEPSLRLDGAIDGRLEVGERESVRLAGRTVEAVRIVQTLSLPNMELKISSWVDDQKEPLLVEYPMPGIGALRMITTDKATAMKDFAAPEFFMPTVVRVDQPIDRKAAKRITYQLRVTGKGDDLPPLPTTGMQTPGARDARSLELVVARQDHAALRQTGAVVPAGELDAAVKPYLAPSLYINSDDPAVTAMAREAAGDERSAYALADKLREYVTREIKEKNLDVGFASASEVCRDRKGDCSEHAVLLAALGRANGLPARVVTGLVYVPTFSGTDNVFGFHMWTQFYVGGQWVDVDAAQRETDCNPTHIALAVLSNKDTSLSEAAFALLPVIGRLKIEVLKTE